MPVVYEQESLGSCTAQSVCAAHHYLQVKQGSKHVFPPSRLFNYYYTRKAEGHTAVDSGAQIRNAIITIGARGTCPEA
eukprot:44021-Eustigmatos_ZCMA.PRE.1